MGAAYLRCLAAAHADVPLWQLDCMVTCMVFGGRTMGLLADAMQHNVPVSLISTLQPFVSFSSSLRKDASKSRNPGFSSAARMSSIRIALPASVAKRRRCLKFWLPLNFNMIVSSYDYCDILVSMYVGGQPLSNYGLRDKNRPI